MSQGQCERLEALVEKQEALMEATKGVLCQSLRHEAESLRTKSESRHHASELRQLSEDLPTVVAWTLSEFSARVFEKDLHQVVEEAVEQERRVKMLDGGGFRPFQKGERSLKSTEVAAHVARLDGQEGATVSQDNFTKPGCEGWILRDLGEVSEWPVKLTTWLVLQRQMPLCRFLK